MSNQAWLFVEDTPQPYDPFAEDSEPGANTVHIAGAASQVPVFWLFCFEKENIIVVGSGKEELPALVSNMTQVHSRLAEREGLARALFPAYAGAWDEFRRAVEVGNRKYLKVDAYEIWMLHEAGAFGRLLEKALNWFVSREKAQLDAMLVLADIEGYDDKTKNFSIRGGDDPERFLYGWLEDE